MNEPSQHLRDIFNEALGFEDGRQRAAYLEQACGADATLRRKVENLIGAHAAAGAFLGRDEDTKILPRTGRSSASSPVPESGPPSRTSDLPDGISEGIGGHIGPYKLREKVGHGGCGVVYVADQTAPVRRRVAIKVIKLGMDTQEVIARFEAERQALALMDHPNIAKVLDAGTTDQGRPYFVMELVRGVKITTYCDQNNLPAKERLDLFIKVCRAIQHAHQKGIIHRDIKPSNILVTLHDAVPVPKVIDFGIAKAVEGRLTDATVYTQLHQFIGTPAYMSPEQAEMSGLDVDTRSDIYSLGVLLYELLSGRTPFDGKELMSMGLDAMRRTIREKEPLRPSTRLLSLAGEELTTTAKRRSVEASKLVKAMRGDLDWIVMKCLEKDRTRRYETAIGLAVDIQRHLNNEPVLARPPSVVYRFQKTFRRNKLAITAAAAVVSALVVGLGISIWQFLEKNTAYEKVLVSEQKEKTARGEAEANARKAEANHREAEASVARQVLQRATERFQAGDPATALSALAHLLRRQPDHAIAACRIVAELSSGNYSLPVAALTDDLDTFLRDVGRFDYARRRSTGNMYAPLYSQHFSPDSRLVVSAGVNDTVRIWDARHGTAVGEPIRHPGRIHSVDFSPDSRQVVTACEDGAVRIWDARTGRAVGSPLAHGRPVLAARFSPDRQTVATLALDRTVALWDGRTGQLLWGLETAAFGWPIDVQFSQGGERLMASSENRIQIWDLASRKPVTDFEWKMWGTVYARPELSSDGLCFMSYGIGYGAGGGQVLLLRPTEPSSQRPIVIDPGGHMLRSARFSPNSRWVVTTRLNESEVKVWDATTGDRAYEPLMHKDVVTYAAFSPDGQRLATCAEDGVARIFEARTGNLLSETRRHGFPVTYAEFSSDGERLLTRAAATTWLWDIRLEQPTSLGFQHEGTRQSATLTGDGERLLTLPEDHRPTIWDVSTGRPLLTINGLADRYAVISPEGRRVAVTVRDPGGGCVRVFDAATGLAVGLPAILSAEAGKPQFSPDGTKLVSRSVHGWVFVHDVETGGIEATLRISGSPIFSPNSRQLLTTIPSGTAQLWDAGTGRPLLEPMLHEGGLDAAAFSPDGSRIATFSNDGWVRLWDARTAKPVDLAPMQHAGSIGRHPLSFSPDAMRLATAAGHGACLWDLRTGAPLVPVMVHEARVNSVRFNPDGTRLITACNDGRARLWDAAQGFLLDASFRHDGEVYDAQFTPDGTRVVTTSADHTARIWKVQPVPSAIPDWLASLAEAVAGQRTDGRGFNHPVGMAELIRLRHQLGGSGSGTGDPELARWAQWFFADSATRRIAADPSSIPVSAHVDRLVEIGTVQTLSEAVRLLPSHPQAAGRLAAALRQGGADGGTSGADPDELSGFLIPGGLSNPKPLLLFQEFVHRDTGGVSSPARSGMVRNIEAYAAATLTPPPTVVPKGAVWRYQDQGQDLGTEWRTLGYDDSAWPEGPGPLGYGESGLLPIATRLSFGSNPTTKHITTYFRHAFPAPTNGLGMSVTLHLRSDRGVIVYLNGREVARNDMPEGPVSAETLATGYIQSDGYWPWEVSQHLQPGINVLAVEVHQAKAGSSDLHFDLMLRQGSPGLAYFWSFSPEQFQAEIRDFLSRVPPTLQGEWTNRFAFAFTTNPGSAPESIKGNWRNWEVRAQLQADLMTHTAEARRAYETCLRLLRATPASETMARRIEVLRQALEELPK